MGNLYYGGWVKVADAMEFRPVSEEMRRRVVEDLRELSATLKFVAQSHDWDTVYGVPVDVLDEAIEMIEALPEKPRTQKQVAYAPTRRLSLP